MTSRHPNLGRMVPDLPTPSLILDIDVFESNCAALADAMASRQVGWRPHVKGHKSPRLARTMIEAGAIGVTCAKVAEAEEMVAAGVGEVLIANQPSTREAWARLARLNRAAWVAASIDSLDHVAMAVAAGRVEGTSIPLLVEVDIGMNRAGVKNAEDAASLAVAIDGHDAVHFAGVMGYEGHLLTLWPEDEKRKAITDAMSLLIEARNAIEASGVEVGIVSCGGSGSYRISSAIPGVTEVQAGGGCLMDEFYRHSCHVDLGQALFVVGSVGSVPAPDRAIVDVGWKAMPNRTATPICRDRNDVVVAQMYAEHLRLESTGAIGLEIGDRVVFVPGYSDETTVLHDEFMGVRNGVVVETIPLLARGALQ